MTASTLPANLASLEESTAPQDPAITVVIPTRDRPGDVPNTVSSILACQYSRAFEVLVIDQTADESTERALAALIGDLRVRYVRTETRGASRARNLGAALARSDIIAFTDDDCLVPVDWLSTIDVAFGANENVGAVFGDVLQGRHDPSQGTIPWHHYERRSTVTTPAGYAASIGMGANLSVRRRAFEQVGGFDDCLGPGGLFPSAEDHDLALRLLRRGWSVLEEPRITVTHLGFRTHAEFRRLTRRDWLGIGAAHGKLLHGAGHTMLPVVGYNVFVRSLLSPLSGLLKGRPPRGLGRQLHYWQGFWLGFRTPVDPRTLRFSIAISNSRHELQ